MLVNSPSEVSYYSRYLIDRTDCWQKVLVEPMYVPMEYTYIVHMVHCKMFVPFRLAYTTSIVLHSNKNNNTTSFKLNIYYLNIACSVLSIYKNML